MSKNTPNAILCLPFKSADFELLCNVDQLCTVHLMQEIAIVTLIFSNSNFLFQATSFFLGALSDMPAVRAFALYAAGSLCINFFMQITCFVAVMSLDQKRYSKGYHDVLCCVKGSTAMEILKPGMIQGIINKYYVPNLFLSWTRSIVLFLFSGWLCTSLAVIPRYFNFSYFNCCFVA